MINSMINSWGNYPKVRDPIKKPVYWRDQSDIFATLPVLPHGNGRSYGDVCFNSHHVMLKTRAMNQQKSVVYAPFFWRYIMWVIRCLPEVVMRKLIP